MRSNKHKIKMSYRGGKQYQYERQHRAGLNVTNSVYTIHELLPKPLLFIHISNNKRITLQYKSLVQILFFIRTIWSAIISSSRFIIFNIRKVFKTLNLRCKFLWLISLYNCKCVLQQQGLEQKRIIDLSAYLFCSKH